MSAAYASRRVTRAQVLQARIRMRVVGELGIVDVGEVLPGDDADRHAEEVIERRVPAGVAAGQVVVDGDEVRATTFERVEVQRKRRDERLAFAGLHLGDAPLVEHDAADQLDVEVAHPEGAFRRLADHRERLRQQIVERLASLGLAQLLLGAFHRHLLGLLAEPGDEGLAVGDVGALDAEALPEFTGLVAKLVVGQRRDLGFELVDEVHDPLVALDLALDGSPRTLLIGFLKMDIAPPHSGSPRRLRHRSHHHRVDQRGPGAAQDRCRRLGRGAGGEHIVDQPDVGAAEIAP